MSRQDGGPLLKERRHRSTKYLKDWMGFNYFTEATRMSFSKIKDTFLFIPVSQKPAVHRSSMPIVLGSRECHVTWAHRPSPAQRSTACMLVVQVSRLRLRQTSMCMYAAASLSSLGTCQLELAMCWRVQGGDGILSISENDVRFAIPYSFRQNTERERERER